MKNIKLIFLTILILDLVLSIDSFAIDNLLIDNSSSRDSSKTQIISKKILVGTDTCEQISIITVIDSVPLVLKTVFPQVAFYLEKTSVTCILGEGLDRGHLMFRFNNQDYKPYFTFNYLISKMNYVNGINLDDIFKAYLTILEIPNKNRMFNTIVISSLKKCKHKIDSQMPPFNYHLEAIINSIKEQIYILEYQKGIYLVAKEIDTNYPLTDKRRYRVYGMEPLPLNYKNE